MTGAEGASNLKNIVTASYCIYQVR